MATTSSAALATSSVPTTTPKSTVLGGTSSSSTASSSATPKSDGLGKQDFLKLLIAQLKNQDPMKPMEDKEFITQLATFSSLEQLQTIGAQFDALNKSQTMSQAASLVGKQVTAAMPDGTTLNGSVSQVRLVGGVPRLVVNDKEIQLSQVTAFGAVTSQAQA